MFSHTDSPPRLRGITWSTVSPNAWWPQYWQVQASRASTALRVILRRWTSRGMRMYRIRRITQGRSNTRRSECSAPSPRSISSARSFSTSTVARRTLQTLIGS